MWCWYGGEPRVKLCPGPQKACSGPVGTDLFLQLAELGGRGLQADPGLLQLLVGGADQVAASVRGLTGALQLPVETRWRLRQKHHVWLHSAKKTFYGAKAGT